MKVAIIGGGAAGVFAALSQKFHHPESDVFIFERSDSLLSKVKISGGGRCNVTHSCFSPAQLSKNYPRGKSFLKKVFQQFSTEDTIQWFESRKVKLKAEEDGRMFPITDSSQTIIDALTNELHELQVHVIKKIGVRKIDQVGGLLTLEFSDGNAQSFQKVIIACGGFNKGIKYKWIERIGHNIIPPVPSLFTFNMPDEQIKVLQGVVAPAASVSIQSTRLQSTGPLLITHWGMSGPAILRLSAFGARLLNQMNYQFKVQINWLGDKKDKDLLLEMNEIRAAHEKKLTKNFNPFKIPNRLWEFLLTKSGIALDLKWSYINGKAQKKLVHTLLHDEYQASGKTTFKEEFVTAGGVDLNEVDPLTMESKIMPSLFFTGEVLDIDGITGGFNFQAAWSTGFVAGKA